VGLRGLGDDDDLFFGRVGPPVADVIADSTAEQYSLLQGDADIAP
jgi:hypothetical protein